MNPLLKMRTHVKMSTLYSTFTNKSKGCQLNAMKKTVGSLEVNLKAQKMPITIEMFTHSGFVIFLPLMPIGLLYEFL